MKHHLLATCALVCGSGLLGGCALGGATFVPSIGVISSGYLTTGAERRVVSEVKPGEYSRPGLVDPQKIICAEPSPDVAKAVSQVISLGASAAANTADKNVDGSLALSASVAEGIASLVERTASIQLLRDKMYQTCLAYSNGAISGTTYSLIMSRLDESIVTLMLGESAAGAFGREGASINAGGVGASGASLGLASMTTADAAQAATKLAEAQTAEEDAKKLVATKETEIANKQREIEEAEVDDEKKGQLETLKTQKTTLEGELVALKTKATQATKTVENLTELYVGSMRAAAVAATRSSSEGVGDIRNRPDAQVAEAVSGIHTAFLEDDYSKVVISSCLVELSHDTTAGATNPGDLINDLRNQIRASKSMLSRMGAQKTDLESAAADKNAPEDRTRGVELAYLSNEIANIEGQVAEDQALLDRLNGAYRNPENADGLSKLTMEVLRAFESEGKLKINEKDLIQAVKIVEKRQKSALSLFCGSQLSTIVYDYSLGMQRLRQNKYNIDYETALATSLRAETDLIAKCEAATSEGIKVWCAARLEELLWSRGDTSDSLE